VLHGGGGGDGAATAITLQSAGGDVGSGGVYVNNGDSGADNGDVDGKSRGVLGITPNGGPVGED